MLVGLGQSRFIKCGNGCSRTYSLGGSTGWANIYGGYLSCFVNQASTYQVGEFRNEHSTYGGGVRCKV